MVLLGVSIAIATRYTLTRAAHEAILAQIEARRVSGSGGGA